MLEESYATNGHLTICEEETWILEAVLPTSVA